MITLDDMRSKLFTLDEVRAGLAATEPITTVPFTVGDALGFEASSDWQHGVVAKMPSDPVPVYFRVGLGNHQRRHQLTLGTLQEMCAAFGFKRSYVTECPPDLLVPHMNYWYREGLLHRARKGKDFQVVVNDQDEAIAFTKQGMQPFSNLAVLDIVEDRMKRESRELLVDYKFSHSLRQTRVRFILADAHRVIEDTGELDDVWSVGLQFNNSLTGTSQTSFEGYLFRWLCTNGMTDTRASSGAYTRRPDTTEAEVYEWARLAVNEALTGLDETLDAVQALTRVGIEGSLADTLRDIFEFHKIAIAHRPKIINYLEQYPGEITMYVIMNAITQVANEAGLEAATIDSLLRVGGDFAHTADQRCGACHRLYHRH